MKRIWPSELIPRRPTIKFEIIKKCNASISTVLFFLSFKICPSRHRFDLLKLFYDTNRRISSINSAKRRCTRSRFQLSKFPPSRRLKKERSWITLVVNAGSGVWKGFNLVFNSRIDRGEGRRRHEHRLHRGTNRMEIISAINCFNLPWKFKRWKNGSVEGALFRGISNLEV